MLEIGLRDSNETEGRFDSGSQQWRGYRSGGGATGLQPACVHAQHRRLEDETDVPEAIALLTDAVEQRIALFSSDLLRYELANALNKGKTLAALEVRIALERLEELPVDLLDLIPASFEHAAALAHKYNISVYDAVDAVIAYELSGTLVTANPRHQGRVQEISVIALGLSAG